MGPRVCERPNHVLLLSVLSGSESGQFGREKTPSLSVLQILSYFVRDAQMAEASANMALQEVGCAHW